MLGAIVLEHNGITWKGATVINATTWRCENGSFSGRPPMRSTCAEGRVAPGFQFRTIVMGVGILFQRPTEQFPDLRVQIRRQQCEVRLASQDGGVRSFQRATVLAQSRSLRVWRLVLANRRMNVFLPCANTTGQTSSGPFVKVKRPLDES